ncbi:MAG: acyl-CoA dehydrogenase family protein, partial [Candidatus Nanopelagicales bacterium]
MTDALETAEARALLELTREIADAELAPVAAAYEEAGEFPRDLLRTLGRAGLLSLPFPERFGGGEQPYEVYLAVLEELSRRWLSVGISVSVHVLATYAMASAGDE